MQEVVFHLFPRATVEYRFILRSKVLFPEGFDKKLRFQIKQMSGLYLTKDETAYLHTISFLRPTYIEWLSGYRYNPDEVIVNQTGGDIEVTIRGPWYRTILWEVPLMALISELYFQMTNQPAQSVWLYKIDKKAIDLEKAECHWIDFGTRRRYSYEVQDYLVYKMSRFKGFLGTSNVHFAHKYGVKSAGTYAHEAIMAMNALYGDFYMANHMWQRHWSDHFDGNVGVALTDTFTTDVFLRNFGTYEARLFDGVRQDSGDPMKWAIKMKNHYANLGINCSNKRFVFSDGLTTEKYIDIDRQVRQFAQPVGGIGTHFSNDVGVVPLNMVIKLNSVDFGFGPVDVIKLSDDISKATGNAEKIEEAKKKVEYSVILKWRMCMYWRYEYCQNYME